MQIVPVRNRLVYPAGIAPGFDPAHVAAGNARLSVVSSGSGLVNILNGKKGAPTSVSFNIDGGVGPGVLQTSASSITTFTGFPTTTDTDATLALIFRPTTFANPGAGCSLLVTSGSSGGWQIKTTVGVNAVGGGVPFAGDLTSSGIVLTVNTPYFIALTVHDVAANATVNYAATNLLTGSVQAATKTNTLTATASDGTYTVGGDGGGNSLQGGTIAAAMYSASSLSAAQLLAWAEDPWSFWYPDPLRLGGQPATPAISATPVRTTFDSAKKAPDSALSNGNLTCTALVTHSNGSMALSTTSHATGKYFVAVHIDNDATSNFTNGIGVCNAAQSFASDHFLGEDNNGLGFYGNGKWWQNNVATLMGSSAIFDTGSEVGIAIDATNRKIWLTTDGGSTWNGDVLANQNPAAGVGGVSLSAITGPLFFGVETDQALNKMTVDFNPGGGPSGFGNWDTSSFPASAQQLVIGGGTGGVGVN